MLAGEEIVGISSDPNDVTSRGQKLPRDPEYRTYLDLQAQQSLYASDTDTSLLSHH